MLKPRILSSRSAKRWSVGSSAGRGGVEGRSRAGRHSFLFPVFQALLIPRQGNRDGHFQPTLSISWSGNFPEFLASEKSFQELKQLLLFPSCQKNQTDSMLLHLTVRLQGDKQISRVQMLGKKADILPTKCLLGK